MGRRQMDFNRDVKLVILKVLQEKGWSLSDLARAMEVERQSLQDMLHEENNLSLGTVQKIATALDIRFKFVAEG